MVYCNPRPRPRVEGEAMKRSTANHYFSKYILLRDAIPPDRDCVRCCTCGRILIRLSRHSHAGHFISKGMGGSSGVYFDERNVHPQCYNCNKWMQGNAIEYHAYMLKCYGADIVEELRRKHHLPRPHSIDEYGIMYREKYKELTHKYGLKK